MENQKKETKRAKVWNWIKEHKWDILEVLTLGAVAGVTAALASDRGHKIGFNEGFEEGCRTMTLGLNPHNTVGNMSYEYAGLSEFYDCDPESADKIFEHIGVKPDYTKLDFGVPDVKRIRNFVYVEFDKDMYNGGTKPKLYPHDPVEALVKAAEDNPKIKVERF